MIGIRDYLIEVLLNNIKENIKLYINNNDDEYFKEITNITSSIDKDETILKYFNENTDALMLLTEETLKELNRVPCIYDLRDGL